MLANRQTLAIRIKLGIAGVEVVHQIVGAQDGAVQFRDDGIAEIAEMATLINSRMENIGARRLYTIMERILDEISFEAPEMTGKAVVIDAQYVREKLKDFIADEDLSRYNL